MMPYAIRRLLLSPSEIHIICAVAGLLGCLPILFPEVCPAEHQTLICHYAGWVILLSVCLSAALMGIAMLIHLFRLRNTRAFWQVISWMSIWGIAFLAFVFIAILADIPPLAPAQKKAPIQTTDILNPADESLRGPSSLVLPLNTEKQQIATIEATPHLSKLDTEHNNIFREYLDKSPRWTAGLHDDLFYTKAGHVVMIPPTHGGTPGMVHVSFRRLVEGDPQPEGYTLVHPGDAMLPEWEQQNRIPDIAIDLGGQHYLLLAWRGAEHPETAAKAINAAITETDNRLKALANTPDHDTLQRLISGTPSIEGATPELRLMEPPGQSGSYQAEIYANPGEPGTILLYINELESGRTLRLLNCPARFSANPNEIFRHDIPGSIPLWLRNTFRNSLDTIFPEGTPLFVIRKEPTPQYFGAAFEVWFIPADREHEKKLLLRRCYRVQGYHAL